MKVKLLFILLVCMLLISTEVHAKNKGNVRFSNRPPKPKGVFKHPDWMDKMAFFMDSIFDWFGYKEIPHFMRYAFILTIVFTPVYAFFFFWCCVHNDEYDDPEEEMMFKERVAKAHARKLARLEKAKQMKWD